MKQIIMVKNNKGGIGKTFVSINLADYLSKTTVNGKQASVLVLTDDGQNNNPAPQPSVQPTPQPEKKPEVNVNLIDNKDDVNKTIKVLPEAKADDLKKKYKNVKDITNEKLATGSTVNIDNNIYTIIKIGDVNKDGEAKEMDAVDILNYSVDLIKLSY